MLDDLTERDRILADAKLLRFRNTADSTLSRKRSDSPFPNESVASERDSADQRTLVEREMSDSLLERERQRSDVAVAPRRGPQSGPQPTDTWTQYMCRLTQTALQALLRKPPSQRVDSRYEVSAKRRCSINAIRPIAL